MPWQAFFKVCETVTGNIAQSFIGVILHGRVLYSCCSGYGQGAQKTTGASESFTSHEFWNGSGNQNVGSSCLHGLLGPCR